jgi:CBS domain-containing protein
MTSNPVTMPAQASVYEAALSMRDSGIGCILVEKDKQLFGIVTDRDLVLRVVAEGKDATNTHLESICSRVVSTLPPDNPIDDAISLMRQKSVRRIPVVEDGKVVGIVSLGDLAAAPGRESVLGDMSIAEPNN